jgi:hypothetical protein
MRAKAAFLIGGVVGYVLGAHTGREQFDKLCSSARKMWEDPWVQSRVSDVEQRASDLVHEKGPELKDKLTGAVKSAADTVRTKAEETTAKVRGMRDAAEE